MLETSQADMQALAAQKELEYSRRLDAEPLQLQAEKSPVPERAPAHRKCAVTY